MGLQNPGPGFLEVGKGERKSASLQPAIWDRLLKLPANFFRRYTAGDLLQRAMAMEQIRPFLSSQPAQIVLNAAFALPYLILMAIYSPKLTLLGVILIGAAVGFTLIFAKWKIGVERQVYELQGKISGSLVQILSGISKLRVAGAENNAFSYWASQFSKSKSYEMYAQNIQNIITTGMTIFPHLSFLARSILGLARVVARPQNTGSTTRGSRRLPWRRRQ